ncbi:MAG: sulfite exporter TauE/SafE family protein, partial [Oscillospiraceae bacterium]|nr:sulfite exporter TauE/SafE family protein [Oscillospiraceae bacterium]
LDLCGWESVAAISFLSGCTVLSMSAYAVGKSMWAREKNVDTRTGTPLAIGAALGGLAGKQLFGKLADLFANPNTVGAVQAACLLFITLGTLIYTLKADKIHTHQVRKVMPCIIIGTVLGLCSGFLGIGGGPINLVVLYFFFSMDTKTAAGNSLYIILFSQTASFLNTIFTGSIPQVTLITLILMVIGGILGGLAGRTLNKKLTDKATRKLLVGVMIAIICISCYNFINYAAL